MKFKNDVKKFVVFGMSKNKVSKNKEIPPSNKEYILNNQ